MSDYRENHLSAQDGITGSIHLGIFGIHRRKDKALEHQIKDKG
jgi:hypothetical protein